VTSSLRILNLEIRNGVFGGLSEVTGGSFVGVGANGTLILTHVVIKNMWSTSLRGGALYGAPNSRGFLEDVSFINCSHASGPAAVHLISVQQFHFRNVSFINCTTLTNDNAAVMRINGSLASSEILFAGEMIFAGYGTNFGTTPVPNVIIEPLISAKVTTDPSNPSKWSFIATPQPGIQSTRGFSRLRVRLSPIRPQGPPHIDYDRCSARLIFWISC
jgi:hypothetical protein